MLYWNRRVGPGGSSSASLRARAIAQALDLRDEFPMQIEDVLARDAIRRTMARLATSGDVGDADGFANGFAEDAVFAFGETRFEGRAAIRAGKVERVQADRAKLLRHNLTTCRIDLTGPDSATARTYFVAFTEAGPDHAGHYADEWRKVDDDWLIVRRIVHTEWLSPTSVFAPLPQQGR